MQVGSIIIIYIYQIIYSLAEMVRFAFYLAGTLVFIKILREKKS